MNNECERLVLCCAAPLLNYGSSIQQLSASQFAPPLAIFHRLHLQSLKINEELQRGNERMCVCVCVCVRGGCVGCSEDRGSEVNQTNAGSQSPRSNRSISQVIV